MRAWPTLLGLPLASLFVGPALAQERNLSFQGTLQGCPNSHNVRLEGNRRYVVTASSEAFDTVLGVYRSGRSEAVAEDDDGGGGTNSRVEFVPPETGEYRLCVSSFRGGAGGAYNVAVEPAAPLPPPVTRANRTEQGSWQVYEGTLAEGDQQDAGRRFDDYEIRLRAGERALVSLESSDFDPVLEVYASERRGAEPIANNDDGGGGLNAFLVLAPEEAGSFILRAKGFSSAEAGAYRLRVSIGAIPPRPAQTATATETPGD